jgi:acetyltransferase-like isoleucine patch superfamily enzyme
MTVVTSLAPYQDERGNRIVVVGGPAGSTPEPPGGETVSIEFRGANNTLTVTRPVRIDQLKVTFDCDNGRLSLHRSKGVAAFSANIRVGQDAAVEIGRNVSSVGSVLITAVEGATVQIGEDVMFSAQNEVRTDDAHPIFDVRTGLRVNPARSVRIGNHVWFGRGAAALSGASIDDGSVIGFRSVVTRAIPNNCVAAGAPARVVRRDIAWERPHLSRVAPFYKPDASTVKRSPYWDVTDSPLHPAAVRHTRRQVRRARRALRRNVAVAALARSTWLRMLLKRG